MPEENAPKRPKSPSIQPINESAPWVLISVAAAESGLTDLLVRKSGVKLRKFGTADYLRPIELNSWIIGDGKEAQP